MPNLAAVDVMDWYDLLISRELQNTTGLERRMPQNGESVQ